MGAKAAIVIPVWNEWEATEACLGSVHATVGDDVEVVVVDNGSRDATPAGLARFPWVTVVTNEENRGFAAACNQGASACTADVIVFLNNDTLVPPGWLERLVGPFGDPNVGATGPRSNFVAGFQCVDGADYDARDAAGFHAWAAAWSAANAGEMDLAPVLIGFCIAVRATAFDEVGGFDEGFGLGGYEDNDLCRKLCEAGWILLVVHDCFVHHEGHRTFDANGVDWAAVQEGNRPRFEALSAPAGGILVSAALITKNESETLARCLDSLSGVVDEVVIYDTGSTDDTVELGRRCGAMVLEGYWDDDFSRARNAAMEQCRGKWVLSIDADEVLETDPRELRHVLSQEQPIDVYSINIANLVGTRSDHHEGLAHHMFRIIRRTRATWKHRLHEQPCSLDGAPDLRRGTIPDARLVHYGYLTDVAQERNKVERNLRLAQRGVDESTESAPEDQVMQLLNLGRSQTWSGNPAEAFVSFELARRIGGSADYRRITLRCGAETLVDLGRIEEALEWVTALREISPAGSSIPSYIEGMARLSRGETSAALALFETIGELRTEEGISYGAEYIAGGKGLALLAEQRWDESLTILLEAGRSSGDYLWAPLLLAIQGAGVDPARMASLVGDRQVPAACAATLAVDPLTADTFLEALWARFEGNARVLAAASRVAPRLRVARALEWSARLRAAGAADRCPLRQIVADPTQAPLESLRAAAVLSAAFGEAPMDADVRRAAANVADADLDATFAEIGELAPPLVPVLIAGASPTARRAVLVAEVLDRLGASEHSGVVLRQVFGHDDLVRARSELASTG